MNNPFGTQIWSVEDYYRVKQLYEANGAVFNPGLVRGSPAANHVIAQHKIRSMLEASAKSDPDGVRARGLLAAVRKYKGFTETGDRVAEQPLGNTCPHDAGQVECYKIIGKHAVNRLSELRQELRDCVEAAYGSERLSPAVDLLAYAKPSILEPDPSVNHNRTPVRSECGSASFVELVRVSQMDLLDRTVCRLRQCFPLKSASNRPAFETASSSNHASAESPNAIAPAAIDRGTRPVPRHSTDFTSVNWFGTRYTFNKGQQAGAVRILWREWEKGGLSIAQETIAEEIGSEDSSFQLSRLFRIRRGKNKGEQHPAWGTMIQSVSKGAYCLCPPD